MTEVILRRARVVDPGGPHHEEEVDILLRNGVVERVGRSLRAPVATELRVNGLHVSMGWVDLRSHFRDPGEEWKCGIANGLDAAAAGGFTAVCALPSTQPITDAQAGVTHMLRRAQGHAVRLLPLGTVTQGMDGKRLAELHDMRKAGALGFTDDTRPIRDARLMANALQYSAGLPGGAPPVMVLPLEQDLTGTGVMHEGSVSARLGLRGIPAEAEALQLARDIALLEYAGGHLHAATISTAQAVELIRKAKARKLRITASVAAHHLLLDDACLSGFESCYKVLPPLRDAPHIEALRQGVKDGTIDAVVSDHRPEDPERKVVEFGHAAFGIIGLETSFAVARTALKAIPVRRLVERFTSGPRAVLGLPAVHIAEGSAADMTLFDPDAAWTCTETDLVSRSRNTPFIGHRFIGRPIGIVAGGQIQLAPAFEGAMA